MLSRGTFLVLSTITHPDLGAGDHARHLVAAAHPLHGEPGQVGPEFYNRVNLPIALLVALLLGARALPDLAGRRRRASCCAGSRPAPSGSWRRRWRSPFGVGDPFHLLFVALVGWR
jgi:hypothetical protein